MDARRYKQVYELFTQAKRLAPESRTAFLNQACAGDTDLRCEIEALLAADANPLPFEAVSGIEVNSELSEANSRSADADDGALNDET